MLSRHGVTFGLIGVAISLSPSVAMAAEGRSSEPLRLSWVREESARKCPDARVVARRVRERLGRDPFSDSAATAAEIVVAQPSGSYVARIRIRSKDGNPGGERTIASEESCETLVSAVALALALYVDPNASLRSPEPVEPDTPPSLPVPAAPRNPPADVPSDQRGPASSVRRAALSAGLLVGHGLLPGFAPAARITAEFRPAPRIHLLLTGALLPEQRTADGRFGFGLTAGGAGACADVVVTKLFELAPCATVLAGEVHAVVYSLDPSEPGGRFWMSAAGLARARVHVLAPWFVELGAGAWVPFVRHEFAVIGRSEVVFQQSLFAPVAEFAVGGAFP